MIVGQTVPRLSGSKKTYPRVADRLSFGKGVFSKHHGSLQGLFWVKELFFTKKMIAGRYVDP